MHFSTQAALLSLLPFTLAQYGNSPASTSSAASSSPSSSSTSGVQTVTVGNGGLSFSPNNITAAVGSVVEFVFYPATHSVAQAAFAAPCAPSTGGFYSGPFSTASGANSTVFSITINNTSPIWFYCAYAKHCEAGMVGVINGPTDGSKTLDEFKSAAASVGSTTIPGTVQGGVIGSAASVSSGTSSSTGSSTGSSTSSGATPSATKNVGIEARGGAKWALMALTGVVAVGMGSLMV